MKVLLTGATGYIAQRLLPVLIEQGHEIICAVRDPARFRRSGFGTEARIEVIQLDLLDPKSPEQIPKDIDAAYYLVHSMSAEGDFQMSEDRSAHHFVAGVNRTSARQIIYLSGIVNNQKLSKHLLSRKNVEDILSSAAIPVTTLRAGIIVGSGSASFEIIRDLVEKLPVMIAPRWLHTKCQPIAIRNVVQFLSGVLLKDFTFGKHFDIYGPDILEYKQMLLQYARVRGLRRKLWIVPVMTPKLSAYWLYFVTSTSYALARNLVDSMRVDVVAEPNELSAKLGIKLIPYKKAISIAFEKIEQNLVLSSWRDALGKARISKSAADLIKVPQFGVFTDVQQMQTSNPSTAVKRIFSIGGKSGWYYGNWLWRFRGFLDKAFGGVGLNRGRTHVASINTGDTVDFWRVIYADPAQQRLLLYAEMKLPGEAWLEFRLEGDTIYQVATFRPTGVWGRLYWYGMLPFHFFLFKGMIKKIAEDNP